MLPEPGVMDLEPGFSSILPPFLPALTSYSICHSPADVHSIKSDQRLADQFPPGGIAVVCVQDKHWVFHMHHHLSLNSVKWAGGAVGKEAGTF